MARVKTGGRKAGTPNKATAEAKAAIEDAFEHLEKQPSKGLKAWALANETLFYTQLFPKLLPLQVNHANHEGDELRVINEIVVRGVRPNAND
jgi:hypothetical protein